MKSSQLVAIVFALMPVSNAQDFSEMIEAHLKSSEKGANIYEL